MLQKNEAGPRIWRSALALKTYFERRLGQTLELLTEAPTLSGNGDIPLGENLRAHGLWGIRPHGPLPLSAIDEILTTFDEIFSPPSPKVLAFPARPSLKSASQADCLIECADAIELHKMAFELHSLSSRYAFLKFYDLEPQSRTYVPDLLALGTLTLFVPDVCQLSVDEQETLRKLMAVRSIERPLVMVGLISPLAEVRGRPRMSLAFLAQISEIHLKMTKTFAEYKRQGLIQYFLDSLSHDRT